MKHNACHEKVDESNKGKRFIINNIICRGQYKHNLSKTQFKGGTTDFHRNTLKYNKNTYTCYIAKRIRYLILKNNLASLLKAHLECVIGSTIEELDAVISNIQHSKTMNLNCNDILQKFIPKLTSRYQIDSIEITQEQNAPYKISLAELQKHKHISFLCISFSLAEKKVTVKLQMDKSKTFTHATLILCRFDKVGFDIVDFLENLH